MEGVRICEVYIEQQIEEGLREGKKPYQLGKELSVWLEKLFEVKIPAESIRSRARRQQAEDRSNDQSATTPEPQSEKEGNKEGTQKISGEDLTLNGEPRLRAPGAGRPRRGDCTEVQP